jgi:hypothetical protein
MLIATLSLRWASSACGEGSSRRRASAQCYPSRQEARQHITGHTNRHLRASLLYESYPGFNRFNVTKPSEVPQPHGMNLPSAFRFWRSADVRVPSGGPLFIVRLNRPKLLTIRLYLLSI